VTNGSSVATTTSQKMLLAIEDASNVASNLWESPHMNSMGTQPFFYKCRVATCIARPKIETIGPQRPRTFALSCGNVASILTTRTCALETDWLAGHVGLELANPSELGRVAFHL
jgi:hypothetical protein